MSGTRAISLRLEEDDVSRLESEAERLGIPMEGLIEMYVRARLSDSEAEAQRRQTGLAMLDRLAKLTAGLPPVDAVRIARQDRDELDLRTEL